MYVEAKAKRPLLPPPTSDEEEEIISQLHNTVHFSFLSCRQPLVMQPNPVRRGGGGGGGAEDGGLPSASTPCPLVVVEDPTCEPPEVFCGLGSLIVEGRVPLQGHERGFGEGPHVPHPAAKHRHECSQDSYMVSGADSDGGAEDAEHSNCDATTPFVGPTALSLSLSLFCPFHSTENVRTQRL